MRSVLSAFRKFRPARLGALLALPIAAAALAFLPGNPATAQPAVRQVPRSTAAAVPRYYIAETGTKQPYASHKFVAAIYSTATGALVARVRTPIRQQSVIGVSAAANDRTFAIATQSPNTRDGLEPVHFYLVRFDPGRKSAHVIDAVPTYVRHGMSFMAFALAPNGRQVAISYQPNTPHQKRSCIIAIVSLKAGSVVRYSSTAGCVGGDTNDPWSMSWTASSSTLAFDWYGSTARSPNLLPGSGVRLLRIGPAGGDPLRNSHLAVRYFTRHGQAATTAGYLSDVAMLTPDGQTVVAATRAFHGADGGFAEFSAQTGRLLRTLDWRPVTGEQQGGPMDVLWSSPAGSTLVVAAPAGHWNRLGIVSGQHLRLLPTSARVSLPAAAW